MTAERDRESGRRDRDHDRALRDELVALLRGGQAHFPVAEAVRGFPPSLAAIRVASIPHTPWRLIEHLRIAQRDILDFCRDPDHVSPEFPDGYWPSGDAPPDDAAWDASIEDFCEDLLAMERLVLDPASDLFAPVPAGDGQSLLREAMLVADHNAYHLGQLLAIRQGVCDD